MLDELWKELARGRVFECSLRAPKWHLDGLQEGDNIYVDPRPAILETLLHELLHRRKPRWGERRVDLTARRLLTTLTEADKIRWWKAYQRRKRVRRPFDTDIDPS